MALRKEGLRTMKKVKSEKRPSTVVCRFRRIFMDQGFLKKAEPNNKAMRDAD